jgi:hypothetical protein
MFKIVVVLVGVLWASLVLISWGSDVDPARTSVQDAPLERSAS